MLFRAFLRVTVITALGSGGLALLVGLATGEKTHVLIRTPTNIFLGMENWKVESGKWKLEIGNWKTGNGEMESGK